MKKNLSFAASSRVKAVLCCSVAVLLSACGGTTDDFDSQQSPNAMTAGETTVAARAGTTAVVGAGPEAPASLAQRTTMPEVTAQAVDGGAPGLPPATPAPCLAGAGPAARAADGSAPAANEFKLSGYQDPCAASGAAGLQTQQLPAA